MNRSDLDRTNALLDFIEHSPVSFAAVQKAQSMLDAAGFVRLSFQNEWALVPGGRYYVTRNGSSLIAFTVPENPVMGFMIAASHSDSPCWKLKTDSEVAMFDRYLKLNTEGYGGMIVSSWFDRPLSLAGRAIVKNGAAFETRVVTFDRDLCLIPNVCIHFNKRKTTFSDLEYGIRRFILGLAKKVIIANQMGLLADTIFSSNNLTSPIAFLGGLAYMFQIYFDFSAYLDMAIGLGRIFGFKFLENFSFPYISKSITEFWR